MEMVRAFSLKKIYRTGEHEVRALDGINLNIKKGQFTAITGASGSGKSTLLHILGGLDQPTEGTVFVEEQNLQEMDSEELTIFRRRNIGFVFQNYNLVPSLNIYENIVLPVRLDSRKVDKDLVIELTNALGIENKLSQMPNELSGGQQQRAAVARAMIIRPKIMLMDEPTGNLDSKTSEGIIHITKFMAEEYHQTIVMITHNEKIAEEADQILRIKDGRLLWNEENR